MGQRYLLHQHLNQFDQGLPYDLSDLVYPFASEQSVVFLSFTTLIAETRIHMNCSFGCLHAAVNLCQLHSHSTYDQLFMLKLDSLVGFVVYYLYMLTLVESFDYVNHSRIASKGSISYYFVD